MQAIDTIRVLAADIVQKAMSGHPGAPMGCAPMAHALFSKVCLLSRMPFSVENWLSTGL